MFVLYISSISAKCKPSGCACRLLSISPKALDIAFRESSQMCFYVVQFYEKNRTLMAY